MTRYGYNSQHRPPAPFVLATVRHPRSGADLNDVPAQIDTAADCTLLPMSMAEELRLERIGDIEIGGVGGTIERMPVYDVLLGIRSFPARPIEVAAHPDERWVVLGRDVLNGHRITLDGPDLVLEIG